jgi:hypothetical protein
MAVCGRHVSLLAALYTWAPWIVLVTLGVRTLVPAPRRRTFVPCSHIPGNAHGHGPDASANKVTSPHLPQAFFGGGTFLMTYATLLFFLLGWFSIYGLLLWQDICP